MRITATIADIKFDASGYKSDVEGAMHGMMLRAMDIFLKEAAPKVPIHTGMARGSFLNLMHLLNAHGYGHGVFIPSGPQATKKDGTPLRYYHVTTRGAGKNKVAITSSRSDAKTPNTAMDKYSTPEKSILKKNSKGEWQFVYETRVAHFNLNEYERGWHAFVLGREAMDRFLLSSQIKEEIPQVINYLKVSAVSSGRGNPYKNFNVRTQKRVK